MFCQSANGGWTSKLYTKLSTKTIQEVRDLQTDEKLQTMEEMELLTIVAIKILADRFPDNKSEWRLVVAKGKTYLKKLMKVEETAF